MKRSFLRAAMRILLALLVLIIVVAFFHAYRFTHFSPDAVKKTRDAAQLSRMEKVKALLFGVSNPRPVSDVFPAQEFEGVVLYDDEFYLKSWIIKAEGAKGTVLLFHGYGGHKSAMIGRSDEFLRMGYNTCLVDFTGSGESSGNRTTIGYREAIEVMLWMDYFHRELGEENIILFGTSMGAAAVLKAMGDYDLTPAGVILECPFGSMYQTVCARFQMMDLPSFPMAGLLVFWGGAQNGFPAFDHNPVEYAKGSKSPTLLLYGGQDPKVSREEIDAIFANLDGEKVLKVYPDAGHENYLSTNREEWISDVREFLSAIKEGR